MSLSSVANVFERDRGKNTARFCEEEGGYSYLGEEAFGIMFKFISFIAL